MGQYHLAVSLSRREFVHPHALGDGLKLIEQAGSRPGGIGTALILLLAASNGYRGGDFDSRDQSGIIGRWAGDQVAVVGDYAEPDDLAPEHEALVYDLCGTLEEVAEQAANLADYAKNSVQPEYAERAARLQSMEPYAAITPLVRATWRGRGSQRMATDGSPGPCLTNHGGGMMTNPEPGFEIEAVSIEEFLRLLKEREEEQTDRNGQGIARRAIFIAQMMDRRPSNYGFPLIRRYVVAAFAYRRDRVSYTRTTSNAVELPETVTKTEGRQQEVYEEIQRNIERGLEELNLNVPVHAGFLRHPTDNGREK